MTASDDRLVAVPDADLVVAVTTPGGTARLAERVVATGAPVVVLGADRFDPERGRRHRLDPTTAALALGRVLPHHGLLLAAAPTREHPYNVARRVLSLDHVLGGRVGLLVGRRDHGVPALPPGTVEHDAAEFAAVVRGLWRTWPLDSIVGDQRSGVFADTDRIRPLDHDGGAGGYRVRGPLTTPSSSQGEPLLAVLADVDLPDADLVVDDPPRLPVATDGTRGSRTGTPSTPSATSETVATGETSETGVTGETGETGPGLPSDAA